jgi:hypothetical protein
MTASPKNRFYPIRSNDAAGSDEISRVDWRRRGEAVPCTKLSYARVSSRKSGGSVMRVRKTIRSVRLAAASIFLLVGMMPSDAGAFTKTGATSSIASKIY